MAVAKKVRATEKLTITKPKFGYLSMVCTGTGPLVQNQFSVKALGTIRDTQEAGTTAKARKARPPRDFEQQWQDATHRGPKGEYGIPASAFRTACIDVCRLSEFKMTHAKMSVFCEADLYGTDGTPLVKITKGTPTRIDHHVRNPTTGGSSVVARPMFAPGWEAVVRLRFDAGQFTASDVLNMMIRVGSQCGIGEGRPFSKKSCGMGWGLFDVKVKGAKRAR